MTEPTFAASQHDAVLAAEHRANVERFHNICRIGTPIWLGMTAADVVLATLVTHSSLAWILTFRAAGVPVLLAALWWTWPGTTIAPERFRALEGLMFLLLSWAVSAMTLSSGGLQSPYTAGLAALLVARGVAIAGPWRQGLLVSLGIVAGQPAILAIGSLRFPEVAAQWSEPAALGNLFVNMAIVASIATLSLLGGHGHWHLRREVLTAKTAGRYELLETLGRGGMGEVWRARIRGTRQEVALKLLQTVDPHSVGRFEREVAALSALHHPHTVRVFDYGITETGVPFFAMELLAGRDLDRTVAIAGRLPWQRAVEITRQVGSALGEAHAKGIVHRDVKPQNVMLVDGVHGGDHAKLLDFGIARETNSTDHLTKVGLLVGTPSFWSPEAVTGGIVDARADVYALGSVLFFALTGRPPFVGDPHALIGMHRSQPPPRLADLGVEVPDWVEVIVARCLAKRPEDRFPDGYSLAEALSAAPLAGPAARAPERPEITAETFGFELPPKAIGSTPPV